MLPVSQSEASKMQTDKQLLPMIASNVMCQQQVNPPTQNYYHQAKVRHLDTCTCTMHTSAHLYYAFVNYRYMHIQMAGDELHLLCKHYSIRRGVFRIGKC